MVLTFDGSFFLGFKEEALNHLSPLTFSVCDRERESVHISQGTVEVR